MPVGKQMPRYRCHKEVFALKIAHIQPDQPTPNSIGCDGAMIQPAEEGYAAFPVDAEYLNRHNPQVGGYYVVYDDGYKSFSPAKPFEDGYTRINE